VVAASTTRAESPVAAAAAPSGATEPTTQTSPDKVIARITHAADPDNYYPPAAKAQGVSGYAVVEVDLDALGQLVDARVLKVDPQDPQFGFADAALQVARKSTFENMSQKAASMRFKVMFMTKL